MPDEKIIGKLDAMGKQCAAFAVSRRKIRAMAKKLDHPENDARFRACVNEAWKTVASIMKDASALRAMTLEAESREAAAATGRKISKAAGAAKKFMEDTLEKVGRNGIFRQ